MDIKTIVIILLNLVIIMTISFGILIVIYSKKRRRIPLPQGIKDIIKNSFIYDILNPIRDKYLRKGERITKSQIKELLKESKCPIILEIGSSTGEDTVLFMQTFKEIKLYCFEPNPNGILEWKEMMRKFSKRHENHKGKYKLFKVGLWNKDGEEIFNIPNNDYKHASGSLKNMSKDYNKYVRGEKRGIVNKIKVKTKKLDTWVKEKGINKIDFIWADVEGAEKELIGGGMKTLNEKTVYFYTECYEDKRYEGAQNLREILNLLPNFRLINIFGNNVLLKNNKLNIRDKLNEKLK